MCVEKCGKARLIALISQEQDSEHIAQKNVGVRKMSSFLYWLFTKTFLARLNRSRERDPWK